MRKHLLATCLATSMLFGPATFAADHYYTQSDHARKEAKKKSVERIGGGAVGGAVIGGLLGGGKGAAIGAAAGGGTGYAYDKHKKNQRRRAIERSYAR
jgi:uncharacterized protein YcfJ